MTPKAGRLSKRIRSGWAYRRESNDCSTSTGGDPTLLEPMAAELVARKVDLIWCANFRYWPKADIYAPRSDSILHIIKLNYLPPDIP